MTTKESQPWELSPHEMSREIIKWRDESNGELTREQWLTQVAQQKLLSYINEQFTITITMQASNNAILRYVAIPEQLWQHICNEVGVEK